MTAEVTEKAPFTPRVLTDFEVKVLHVALKTANNTGWCDSGVNEALREMGLPTKPQPKYNRVTVTVPTKGSIVYNFTSGQTQEEMLATVERYNNANRTYNRLEYGTRGGPLEFDVENATWTGLPEEGDTRTDEEKQWDAAMEQVNAYRAAQNGTSTDTDEDDDDEDEDDDA